MRRVFVPLLMALSGCGSGEAQLDVSIATEHCGPEHEAFDGVTTLGVQVTGRPEVLIPVPHQVQMVKAAAPFAKGLAVELRGYDANHAVLSRGRSAPFALEQGAAPPDVSVFFRRSNMFSCGERLPQPRAGHSATVLSDGEVFFVGGYDLTGDSGAAETLFSTELFDPVRLTFAPRHELSIANGVERLPRARQPAALLSDGQVVLWGGETFNALSPVSSIVLVYDVDSNNFGPLPMRNIPPSIPRARHRLATDSGGRVVAAGGVTLDGNGSFTPADAVEWFDDTVNGIFVVNGVSLPRDGAAVVATQDAKVIAIAGGSDGGAVSGDVALLRWNGTTFVRSAMTPAISPRRDAAAAAVLGMNDLFLAGGFSDPAGSAPLGTTELVDTVSGVSIAGPGIVARGQACAVAFDDADVLVAGGEDGNVASAAAELVHFDRDGGISVTELPPLPAARFDHSCTLLDDGTVLIAGGANEHGVLQDSYVFQP